MPLPPALVPPHYAVAVLSRRVFDKSLPIGVFSYMDFGAKLALVLGLFSLTFMLNVPFGFLRQRTRRLSFNWFLCIHAPIPIVLLGRLFSHLDVRYVPIFIAAALIGQIWGGKLEL